MREEKLIRTSLEAVCKKSVGVDDRLAKYAQAALHQLDEIREVIHDADNVAKLAELLIAENSCIPKGLSKDEQEDYALFIHKLFKEGECHEMVHEDPLAASILANGAITALKKAVIDNGKYLLLPQAIDLMMLGTIAQLLYGSKDIARIQLSSLLNVAVNDDVIEAFGHSVPEAMKGILPARVLPNLIALSDIFTTDEEEGKKRRVIMLTAAQALLGEMTETRELYPGTPAEYIRALLSLADFYMSAEVQQKAFDMVYKAIDIIEDDLKHSSFSTAYCFSAALAYQKRAEIAILKDDYAEAESFLDKAIEFVDQALRSHPTNTHYEDFRSEALNQLGIVYGMQGNIPAAQNILLEVVECRRGMAQKSEQYKIGLISALNNMTTLLARFGNLKVALAYGDECLEVAEGLDEQECPPGFSTMLKALRRSRESLQEALETKPTDWRKFNDSDRFGPN
jgi:tetratricopeptide (TPR) repeat protein